MSNKKEYLIYNYAVSYALTEGVTLLYAKVYYLRLLCISGDSTDLAGS